MNGTVKWFNNKKGYGFIIGEDSKEYFFHHTGLLNNYVPTEKDAVVFETKKGDKGMQAVNVTKE